MPHIFYLLAHVLSLTDIILPSEKCRAGLRNVEPKSQLTAATRRPFALKLCALRVGQYRRDDLGLAARVDA